MGKFNTRFISVLIVFICSALVSSCSLFEKKLKLEIPDSNWPGIAFRYIDATTEFASLRQLREKHLAEDDLEVRVWRSGLMPMEGIVLSRISGIWSALYVVSDDCCEIRGASKKVLPAPKSGWDNLWSSLDAEGISTLPDSSQVDCGPIGPDGIGYVVELNQNNTYRTYMYQTSYAPKCEQVQKIKQIGRIIANEFYDGKEECVDARWLPCVAKYGVKNDL
jgi:hypothetical protein